jgi:hypothetical protein
MLVMYFNYPHHSKLEAHDVIEDASSLCVVILYTRPTSRHTLDIAPSAEPANSSSMQTSLMIHQSCLNCHVRPTNIIPTSRLIYYLIDLQLPNVRIGLDLVDDVVLEPAIDN